MASFAVILSEITVAGIIRGLYAAHDTRSLDLLSDAQPGNDRTIALNIFFLEIVKQATAFTDHLIHAKTTVVIMLVHLQVLGKLGNALGKNSDLHLG